MHTNRTNRTNRTNITNITGLPSMNFEGGSPPGSPFFRVVSDQKNQFPRKEISFHNIALICEKRNMSMKRDIFTYIHI